jgi:prevent-host-death family protein
MKEIGFSEFRIKCSAILEQVRKTRQPIRVTHLGKPLAEIVPLSPAMGTARVLGSMAGAAHIKSRKNVPRKSKASLER